MTYTDPHVHRPGRDSRPVLCGTGGTIGDGPICQSAPVGAYRCSWGSGADRGAGLVGGLGERVQSALAGDPDLSLSDLCVLVQSDDTSMVSTLARMARLRARRGNVQATPQSDSTTVTGSRLGLHSPGSVVASDRVGGD